MRRLRRSVPASKLPKKVQKKIAQFSDTPKDKFSEETKKRASYYGILPDSIRSVNDEFEDSIVIGVSDKNNIKA